MASIENQAYAWDLAAIERTLLAMELTPLPKAPESILGAINLHGSLLPVINLRQLLNLGEKAIDVTDHLIICSTAPSPVAFLVDRVIGVISVNDRDLMPVEKISSTLPYVQSVVQKADQMILLLNLHQVLTHATRAETHIS